MEERIHKYTFINIIYGVLLLTGIIMSIAGLFFIPVNTYSAMSEIPATQLIPDEEVDVNEDVREFYFRDVDWRGAGACLSFLSTHQEVFVWADGELVFSRTASQTIWGHTTGFAWEYIELPAEAREVKVTITACYPDVRDSSITFYHGFASVLIKNVFQQEGFTMVISFLNVCLGIILMCYGMLMRKRTNVGTAMIYLGIFTVLVGVWSISDSGITAILMNNRADNSFVSYVSLALVGMPFVMFVHCYLQPKDKYIYKAVLALNIVVMFAVFLLQAFEIKDMKQTLIMIHIGMVAAFLYLPFGIIRMLRRRIITRRFWVTVCSLLTVLPPLAYSLYMYYSGSHNVNSYANVFIFVFIAIFAVDVSRSIMKDIEAGKKAAIYKELAVKDMLTGCYNRNAYRHDTENWEELDGVLLVTCDLNNLKQCNDTLGHTYGDQYIIDSANILKKIFLKYGKLYRIGGDEFVVIIPDSKRCSIEAMLANMTEEQRLYNEESEYISMHIACGYAEYDSSVDSNMEDIRIRADERMYEHKRELKAAGTA